MPRLKSLTAHVPGDFQYIQPETGMAKPFKGSFSSVVHQVMSLRKANKYLAEKHSWALDRAGVEHDVEQQNVARMIAHGWHAFIESEAPAYVPPAYDGVKKKQGAVAAVKRVAAGVGVLLDWLGESGKPIDQALSEKRAGVCAACPLNGKGNLLDYFTSKAADKIKTQLEMRNDLALKTNRDAELGVCEACSCHLPLKVHVPLKHILAHTSAEIRAKLHPSCWILHEKAS